MDNIILRKDNVVKMAISEESARSLEARGFVREGAPMESRDASGAVTVEEVVVSALKEQLAMAAETIAIAEKERMEAESRLKEAEAKLAEAEKEVKTLTLELAGTREQLEAAVRKNKAASGKEKKQEENHDGEAGKGTGS